MLLNSVQLQIDRDDDRKYLRVRIPDSKKMPVYRYQIEMIANNPSESIIPFEYHRKDHDYFFYYNIQSRISLRDYIEKHRFSKNEFIDLLTGITENILESRRLLLNEQNFLLDEEHIYLTQESALPGLIYIPAGSGLFRLQEFKDLVIRLIAKAAFTMGRGGGGFLYRIIGYLKEDSFSLPGFKRLLEDLKEGSGNGVENDVFTMNGGSKDVFNGENEFLNDEADINRGGSRNDVLNGRRLVYAAISQIVIITLAVFADWVLKSRGLMQVLRYGLITAMVLAYDAIILKLLIFRRSRTGQELARDTCLEDSDLSNMQDLDVANLRNSDMAQMQNPNMAGMQDLNIQDSKEKYLQGFKDKPDLYSDANGASDRQLQIEETYSR
jgi:hypothetical protein